MAAMEMLLRIRYKEHVARTIMEGFCCDGHVALDVLLGIGCSGP